MTVSDISRAMDAPQPIAYEVVSERGREAVYAAELREHAERACEINGWRLVPIYPVTKPLPKEKRA